MAIRTVKSTLQRQRGTPQLFVLHLMYFLATRAETKARHARLSSNVSLTRVAPFISGLGLLMQIMLLTICRLFL